MNESAFALNSEQQDFVDSVEPNVRLLAPAGCGKTQSLLLRCANLVKKAKGEHIKLLLFTFTKAARDELVNRLKSDPYLSPCAGNITVTTLNAWGFRRLKSSRHNLKLQTSKSDRFFCLNNLLQPEWANNQRIAEVLADNRRRTKASHEIMDIMDLCKSLGFDHRTLKTIEDLEDQVGNAIRAGLGFHIQSIVDVLYDLEILRGEKANWKKEFFKHFLPFWRKATEKTYRSAVLTFEDQKYWSWIELTEQLKLKKFLGGAARYNHVLVDEFQDINLLDLNLLRSIIEINRATITLVGDDDQAIYEWRGASPNFILRPDEHFGVTFKTSILSVNYRSPSNIVALSQKLISINQRRVPKAMRASSDRSADVRLMQLPNLAETVEHVVALVEARLAENPDGKIALIGRKRSQIIPYQIVFAGKDIPFCAAEDLHVFLSDAFQELKDLLAIKAMADAPRMFGANPADSLVTLCNKIKRYPLAKAEREQLQRHLRQKNPKSLREATLVLRHYDGPIKRDASGRIAAEFADAVVELLDSSTVSDAIRALSDNFEGLSKDYGKSQEDIFYTDPPFFHLAEFAERYGDDYQAFYDDLDKANGTLVHVVPDDKEDQSGEDSIWKAPLHLMTALRAKGKEFDTVIILDANDGIWPSKLAQSEEQLEQERRLFYVAVTRAQRRLFFLLNEQMQARAAAPSPYLAEMGLLDSPPF